MPISPRSKTLPSSLLPLLGSAGGAERGGWTQMDSEEEGAGLLVFEPAEYAYAQAPALFALRSERCWGPAVRVLRLLLYIDT